MNAQGAGLQGGGVILSHRHVLTSGFATQATFPVLEVRVGGGLRDNHALRDVVGRAIHGSFVANPRSFDIGIIILRESLVFSRFVQPVRLPEFNVDLPHENEQLTVLGFGGFPGSTQNRSMMILIFFQVQMNLIF
jgi:hypothetical protein